MNRLKRSKQTKTKIVFDHRTYNTVRRAAELAESIPLKNLEKIVKEAGKYKKFIPLSPFHKVVNDYDDEVREIKTEKKQITTIKEVGHFPTSANTKWQDVKMYLIDEDHFKIIVRNIKREVHYSQMGFNHKKSRKPIKSWKILIVLARKKDGLKFDEVEKYLDKRQLSKRIEEINKKLPTYFGISDKPIPPYNSKNGYKPSFIIDDLSYLKGHEDSILEDADNDSLG